MFTTVTPTLDETLKQNKSEQAEWVARWHANDGTKAATVSTTLTCDDLQRRLDMLRGCGVLSYEDGAVKITFERRAGRSDQSNG